MAAWEKIYESRIVTPEVAATKIQSDQRIFLNRQLLRAPKGTRRAGEVRSKCAEC